MAEDEVFLFIQRHLKSVWALELLLLFFFHQDRGWRRDELVRELRGSEVVVEEALESLRSAGLVVETPQQVLKFAPLDEAVQDLVTSVAELYSKRPMSVIKAISGSPNDKLRIFSDAFKIRDD